MLFILILASQKASLVFFFTFTFPKNWVGRAMGNDTFYCDGLIVKCLPFHIPSA